MKRILVFCCVDDRVDGPDISIASAVLNGWSPHVALHAGLIRTIDYFKGLVASRVDQDARSEARR